MDTIPPNQVLYFIWAMAVGVIFVIFYIKHIIDKES